MSELYHRAAKEGAPPKLWRRPRSASRQPKWQRRSSTSPRRTCNNRSNNSPSTRSVNPFIRTSLPMSPPILAMWPKHYARMKLSGGKLFSASSIALPPIGCFSRVSPGQCRWGLLRCNVSSTPTFEQSWTRITKSLRGAWQISFVSTNMPPS